MVDRIHRISEEVRKEISEIIRTELEDPRLPQLLSVTLADVTKDLRHAKILVSVLGNEEEKSNALSALKSAAGFIRREVGHRMQLRYTPEMHFELDNSIEKGAYITNLIRNTIKQEEPSDSE